MATVNDDLITNFLIGKDELTPALKRAYTAGQNYAKFNQGLNTETKAFTGGMNDMNKKLEESKKRFDMNILSWTFGGMAIQRIGLSMTRFLIPSMDKLEKLNTVAAKKVMGVSAAFEFLKISIFETLMSTPMFQEFVAWLIKAAIWVSELVQKNPLIAEIAAIIAGLALTLGTIAMGVGIFGQLEHLGTLLGTSGKGGILGAIKKINSEWIDLNKLLGAGLLVYAGIKLYKAFTGEEVSSWGDVITTAISAGLGAGLVFSPVTGIITGLIVAASMTIDKFMDEDKLREKLMSAVDSAKLEEALSERVAGLKTVIGQSQTGSTITTKQVQTWGEARENPAIKKRIENQLAMEGFAKKYQEELASLNSLQSEFDELSKTSTNQKELENLTNKIKETQWSIQDMGNTAQQASKLYGFEELLVLMSKSESKIEAAKIATQNKASATQVASQQEIDSYVATFAEQLKSVEKTQEMIENTKNFGITVNDVMGGTKDKVGVIGQFNAFGKEIILDNQYFTTLKTDINTWASTETVKIIKIKYVTEGSSGGSGGKEGIFERAGRRVDQAFAGGD